MGGFLRGARTLAQTVVVKACLFLMVNHSVHYACEWAHHRYCVPSLGFWYSMVTNGSNVCSNLRYVSQLSSSNALLALTSVAYVIGGLNGSFSYAVGHPDPSQSSSPPPAA